MNTTIQSVLLSPPDNPAKLEDWVGTLSSDELETAILMISNIEKLGVKDTLKDLLNEKNVRKDNPENSARARVLQKLLDRIGNSNRDHTRLI